MANNNGIVTRDFLALVRTKKANVNSLVHWFDSMQWGTGIFWQGNVKTYFIPVLEELTKYQPRLLTHIVYDPNGSQAGGAVISVIDNSGGNHVAQSNNVLDPSVSQRILDLLHHVPVVSQALTLAQAQLKVLQFLSNPIRVAEIVGGMVLIFIGFNAMLKGKPATEVKKATEFAVPELRAARRASRGTRTLAQRGRIKTGATQERSTLREQASIRSQARKDITAQNARVARDARLATAARST